MTKKVRHWRGRSKTTASVIKTVNKDNFASAICPTNVEEQKKQFLASGKTPEFKHRGSEEQLEEIYSKPRSEIRFDLLGEALHILKTVKNKYGDAENYYIEMYGERVTKEEATDILVDYLKENHLDGAMSVIWCTDLPCSGRMMWQGPHVKYRRPEARKYSMWIKDSKDNQFLRVQGMRCLADHEIGTHFFRSYNDGLQPWFSDRSRFGIRGLSGLDQLRSEEGLAAVNTILNAKVRYLWGPALLYYIACKATEMTFKQLFEHLEIYVENPETRWRHCVRVKRGLLNPNDIGGYGKDQCYFEGAVAILRNIDNIDFKVLMSGKVCYDEINRVKKLARLECIQMPAFMRNQEKYKKSLKQIAHMNGLNLKHPKFTAPMAYIRRLKRGRRIGVVGGNNKVRKKGVGYHSGGFGVSSEGEGSECEEDSDVGDQQKFYYQQYALSQKLNEPTGDALLEALKGNRVNEAEYLREINEKNSLEYYKSIVDEMEKEKNRHKNESNTGNKTKHKTSVPSSDTNSSIGETESDSSHLQYRCVSRASIHSIINSRSNSLGSRVANKNKNAADDNMSSCSRPTSAVGSDDHTSLGQSKYSETFKSPEQLSDNDEVGIPKADKVHLLSNIYANKKPAHHLSPLSTSIVCATSTYEHTAQSHTGSRPGNENNTTNVTIATNVIVAKHTPHPPLAKSISAHNVMRPQYVKTTATDGFIYPDNDILTDDMIKIKTGLETCEISSKEQGTSQTESANQTKLLNRRVKSAANVLPKLPD